MSDIFHTIAAPSEGLYKEKMSKFISFAIPVKTAAEAKEQVARIANKYHDARHVCWAYMIGPDRKEFLSSDNGEPSGTAGKPILGQINSFGLTDIVIVVVRYFGGIKLGTSGLIGAYREAARDAIGNGVVIECHKRDTIVFTFPYLSMNAVMKITKSSLVTVISQEFDNVCTMTIETNADHTASVRGMLENIDGVCLC
ncbi:MAG: YigZ family protein [Muribaculaceae bacterium]|nr:YigZ family protein [Muribaculaceae bacterium]